MIFPLGWVQIEQGSVSQTRSDFASWRLRVKTVIKDCERRCSRKDAKTQRDAKLEMTRHLLSCDTFGR